MDTLDDDKQMEKTLDDMVNKIDISAMNDSQKPKMKSIGQGQADMIVNMVLSRVLLFHDEYGISYGQIYIDDHHEIWRCKDKKFKQWIAYTFWVVMSKTFSSDAIKSALNIIEAKAQFHGETVKLNNRVAFGDNVIWYDLCNKKWQVVLIKAEGWEIVDAPIILFNRHNHQKEQVIPQTGGDLNLFTELINLKDESQYLLLIAYLVSCLFADIPHPIIMLTGVQGAAKTTLFRMIRKIIDPSVMEVLTPPTSKAELVQQISHHWTPFYDNISSVPDWLSDAFCRTVTGEGFSKREIYTIDDDMIYSFRRCLGLNGINTPARKGDLLDRSLIFILNRITREDRQDETSFWKTFNERLPLILGGLFDLTVKVLKILPEVQLTDTPRMADFARIGCAVAQAMELPQKRFMDAYNANLKIQNQEVIMESLVATVLIDFMNVRDNWEGSVTALCNALNDFAGVTAKINTKVRGWPKAPNALSRQLNIIKTNLAEVGIIIETTADSKGHKKIALHNVSKNTGNTVLPPVYTSSISDGTGDTTDITDILNNL